MVPVGKRGDAGKTSTLLTQRLPRLEGPHNAPLEPFLNCLFDTKGPIPGRALPPVTDH